MDILIKSFSGFSLIQVEQTKHRFGFGAAINTKSLIDNEKYRDFFLKHFEWGVMESSMKWTETEKKKVTRLLSILVLQLLKILAIPKL